MEATKIHHIKSMAGYIERHSLEDELIQIKTVMGKELLGAYLDGVLIQKIFGASLIFDDNFEGYKHKLLHGRDIVTQSSLFMESRDLRYKAMAGWSVYFNLFGHRQFIEQAIKEGNVHYFTCEMKY